MSDYVQSRVGHIQDPSAYASYDALWVIAKCIGLTQQYNGEAINKVFAAVSNMTYGASGWLELNQYGDRTMGDYQFGQVYFSPTTTGHSTAYGWYNSGLYKAETDSVVWYPHP